MTETKIESITITPFEISGSSSLPISFYIAVNFTHQISDNSIYNYLTIRDRNLKPIPTTDISFSNISSDNRKNWTGNVKIYKTELYYQDAQILGNYNNHYIVAKINVDTVTTYTYSNEMRGPNNGTLIAHYKPCYKIERINTQIVNIFEEDITHDTCAIFGINEKTFETMVDGSNNTKMGYKNSGNGNYEFYNSQGEVILSNGIPDISKGYGSITSNAYTFRFKVGFISFTIIEHKHKEILIEIINRSLERWMSMVNKPIASKFENNNDYNNYTHQISFKVQNFDDSQGEVLSSIITNYGTTFGNIFPLTSEIILNEGYLTKQETNYEGTTVINGSNNILSIEQRIQRAIGNILGIGHYWYLQTSPISYDALDKPYYSGPHGVEQYEAFVTKIFSYKDRIIGMPIENYTENNLFIEEGIESGKSKMVTINGLTHPGLETELMTNWFDVNNVDGVAEVLPISVVSLGLLEDIGYDVCYNAIDNSYNLPQLEKIDYEIYIDYDLSINMFERLTDVYIQNKNNYHVKISNPITQGDLDNLLSDYITTVINNSVSNSINELIVTHNSNVDANWVSINGVNVNILQNTNNETTASANDTRVYKFTTIKHDDGSITALLDKQINV
jgi:hypothetical protein